MSEKNNIFEDDLLMRSILDSGQEEVPERVWEGVSARLDEVEGNSSRNVVRLWWKRAGITVSAAGVAAAVLVAVLMSDRRQDFNIVPMAVHGDMIAVAEPVITATQESEPQLLAYAPEISAKSNSIETLIEEYVEKEAVVEEVVEAASNEQTDIIASYNKPAGVPTSNKPAEQVNNNAEAYGHNPFDWAEESPSRCTKTSFVISGITGAADTRTSGSNGILKAPAVIVAPTETGIKEKENQTTYGIPVSAGAGARFELSPKWSLGVGINYTNLTRTLSGTYTHINENGDIDEMVTSKIKNSQHYVGLPINVYFNIIDAKNLSLYTYAGGTLERCFSNKYHVLANNTIHKEAVKGVQLSANVGLGFEYLLGQHLGLYIDPSLRYYFDCDQPRSIRTAKPLMFGAEVGLRFRL